MTWAPGEIAECVSDVWHHPLTGAPPECASPVLGGRYLVKSVRVYLGREFLSLVGLEDGWGACNFRKVVNVGYEEPRRARVPQPAGWAVWPSSAPYTITTW